jgi:acetyl esterase/lipase
MKQFFLYLCMLIGICSIGAISDNTSCDDLLKQNADSLLSHSSDSVLYAHVRDTLIVWTEIEMDTLTQYVNVSVKKSNYPALNDAVSKVILQSIPPCFIATYGNEVFMNNGVIGIVWCFRPNRR